MTLETMTNERLEQLLIRALKYVDPTVLGLTADEACYLGVPGTYVVPVVPAHWVDRGGGYECSSCGKWVKDIADACPECGRKMV